MAGVRPGAYLSDASIVSSIASAGGGTSRDVRSGAGGGSRWSSSTPAGRPEYRARKSVSTEVKVLQRLDHAGVFGLIAGTFTAVHGVLYQGRMRWVPLATMWAAAAAGASFKFAYMDDVPEWAGLSAYLVTGWVGGLSAGLLWRRHGFRFVRPFAAGGLVFAAGAAMEYARWPVLVPGLVHSHEVFHLLALAGAAMHYALVWEFADGTRPATVPTAGPLWPNRRRSGS